MTRHRFPPHPGHFPGDPIVPGAALLAFVDAAHGPLVRLERVRFLAPVRPGDEVELHADGGRFSLRVDGREVARGWFTARSEPGPDRR